MADNNDQRLNQLRRNLRERRSRLPTAVVHLARLVVGEADESITHEECQGLLPEYVDAEIAGEDIAVKYTQVKRHLDWCDDCSEQYAELLELILSDRAGQISIPASIPDPDLSFLNTQAPAFPEFVKQKAIAILTVLASSEVPDLVSIADTFFRRVESLGGHFSLSAGTSKAMGFGSGESGMPLTTLAVVFSTTRALVDSFSPEQVDALAAQNLLAKHIEERALNVARELQVSDDKAKEIAKLIATEVVADPASLRCLIERKTS